MSVLVPEEVRRLFQVLTGEDMTDADEDALFAVAGALEAGAVAVEAVGPVVRDVVWHVRGGFSGKAADRFAQRLEAFGPVLESGGAGLRELAGFVRNLALQVQYLKFVTVGGLLLLFAEIAWAVAMAGPTGGASMAWLAARFAVMRFLLTRWWGQLFMRLAVAQVVGIGLQVVMDAGAQGLQFALGARKKWDAAMSEMAVGVGSFSAVLALPLSALGNVVGNAISKVLMRGLGDKIDAEVLAVAAKHAAEEHAQLYPLSSMARFADVVAKSLDDYTGMSVRAMWAARFGHGLGESLEEGLTEMFGEAGYGAMSGQGAQWNPFSFTAGVSEAVGSGIGKLTGLALRGQLIPAGRARDAASGGKDSGNADTTADTSEDSKTDSGSQPDEKSGSPSTVIPPGYRHESGARAPAEMRGPDGPDTPPPYSPPQSDGHLSSGSPGSDGAAGIGGFRAGSPPPAYSPVAGVDQVGTESPGAASPAEWIGHSIVSVGYAAPMPGAGSVDQGGSPIADDMVAVGNSRADSPHDDDHPGTEQSDVDGHGGRGGSPKSDVVATAVGSRVGAQQPVHGPVAENDQPGVGTSGVGSRGVPVAHPAPLMGAGSPSSGGSLVSAGEVTAGEPRADSRHEDRTGTEGVPQSPALPGSLTLPGSSSGPVLEMGPALSAGAVRVSVPEDVVAGGGVAEFVRAQVDDACAGPVVLVPGVGSGVAVVVSSRQASEVARGLGRDVVALMPGRGLLGPRWMRFAPDGSRPRPVDGPGRIEVPKPFYEGREGLDVLASSPTAVPAVETVVAGSTEAGSAESMSVGAEAPTARDTALGSPNPAEEQPASTAVAEWTESDLRVAVERAVGGPRGVAVRIVQGTHDVVALARGDAVVSLEDVVALVAAWAGEVSRADAMRLSRELAARLGTEGTGLAVQAGAGQEPSADLPGLEDANSGQSGDMADESTGIPMSWGLGPTGAEFADDLATWSFDPIAAEQWWGPVPDMGAAALSVPGEDGNRDVDEAAPIGESSGRKRGRSDDSADEADARRPAGPSSTAEGSADVGEAGQAEARRTQDADAPDTGGELPAVFPRDARWGWAGLALVYGRSDVLVEFAEVTGRMQRHLATLPPDFRPDVRARVEGAKKSLAEQLIWTPQQLAAIGSKLPGARQMERALRDTRLRMVRLIYDRARQSIAQGRDPIQFYPEGVPGGVSSRPDVRFGFEVEFQLPEGDLTPQLEKLGQHLNAEGLLDWVDVDTSMSGEAAAASVVAGGKWVLVWESGRHEVEAVSPILRAGAWPDVARLLNAARVHGGDASESGGHVNVSFDWPLTPVQYVRVAQLAKGFEALLYRLGNIPGDQDGTEQRDITRAGPLPLPIDPNTMEQHETTHDAYEPIRYLNSGKYDAVRFGVEGDHDTDRTEFRLWAGSLDPAVWQVRAELSAGMMVAATDPTIYRELAQRIVDPDLLGHEDPGLDDEARLGRLLEFLELLPLSSAAQRQVVQLFAATQPWQETENYDENLRTQTVDLPNNSMLFPAPGTSKASAVAAGYSYRLYEEANLILASLTPDQDQIQLWDGRVIDFDEFAGVLDERGADADPDTWIVLAIPGSAALVLPYLVTEKVLDRRVLACFELSRTPDGRLVTDASGWVEFVPGSEYGRPTGKADLGEALTEAMNTLGDDDESVVVPNWPVREPRGDA
ncbi:WXG100-like domain-containing protein [Saccharopolyspora phatthalungensis]|uniref:Outer membrane channel protein CpnT-like N-terminal domain-containing protein n=1 Tax=Saccharopolyspora phatthalungensis TaxID=664693 RepID=A0A840QGE0_9PSEU|nr:hypothetical protein [Saccharopolyspora phatthalungensis]MBB5157679.1 hypothetical protein [Saccharopolyspora phatthalungensis]